MQRGFFVFHSLSPMSLSLPSSCPISAAIPEKLLEYGPVQEFATPDGDRITTLPTCTVPIECLVRSNWAKLQYPKSNRDVRKISTLIDGSCVRLFSKSFEHVCCVYEVFDQLAWESVILLELIRHGFRAEIPQALIRGKQLHDQHLVVNAIADGSTAKLEACFRGQAYKDPNPERQSILKNVQSKTMLELGDDAHHNFLTDTDDQEWIIDVIRWGFRPIRKRLEVLILEKSAAAKMQ